MTPDPPAAGRTLLGRAWPYALVAAASALALAGGPFSGRPLYFRDLSLHFLPLRRFLLEGIAAGELRFWNPFVHEGEPLALPPIAYPFDLLQLLRPDETGISIVLALHVPLAAVFMMVLARRGLGLSVAGAAGAALVYALGGFALSTVNLYVYAQALAWAPAAILGLMRAGAGGARSVALAAIATGVLVSTTAAEMASQALVIGTILALPATRAGIARMAAAVALGAALAAPVVAVMAGVAADSARAGGFAPEVTLAHSVHPLTLAQVIVAGFHGDPARLVDRWWGGNFFPRGFPYFLSLYLGPAVLAAAAAGATVRRPLRRRLLAIAAVGLLLALGRWGIAGGLVDLLDVARRFRYPSKAFFSVHLAAALLAGIGLDALASGARAVSRRLAFGALAAGVLLATAPLWPRIAPERARWFAAGFFPPEIAWPDRMALLGWVLRDAATGAAVCAVLGALALLASRGRIAPRAAAAAAAALIAADLLRAGAGLNPSVDPAFFRPSPEIARHHAAWRAAGRVFTCDPASSRSYALGRALRPDHERWTFAILRDALVPSFNVTAGVPTALSPDLTMLVPPERLLDPEDAACGPLDRVVARARDAGVGHVLSLDPLAHPDLVPQAAEEPAALVPVTVFAYAVRDPLPLAQALDDAGRPAGAARVVRRSPGNVALAVAAPAAVLAVFHEAYAAGWTGTLDGAPAEVVRAGGRHLGMRVPAGAHTVAFAYTPRGWRAGVAIGLLAAVVTLALAARRRRDASGAPTPPPPG